MLRTDESDDGVRSTITEEYLSLTIYDVLLVLAVLVTGGILSYFNVPPTVIRNTIVWISAAIYLLFLTRKFQIFTSYCSVFSAFLYLCALEIIPTGTLVVSAIIF